MSNPDHTRQDVNDKSPHKKEGGKKQDLAPDTSPAGAPAATQAHASSQKAPDPAPVPFAASTKEGRT